MSSLISESRHQFLSDIRDRIFWIDGNGVPTNADKDNPQSSLISGRLARILACQNGGKRLAAQTAGAVFESTVERFVAQTFLNLNMLRPGDFQVKKLDARSAGAIAAFDQYSHLIQLKDLAKQYPELATILGEDYLISPDVVVLRMPCSDEFINRDKSVVDLGTARLTPIRYENTNLPTLHASISCKWTIRSDRAQNSKSEALNLVRNRKGRLPHIAVVTGEPLPSRLASIALGTGDIDCVYHFALTELQQAVSDVGDATANELLDSLVSGKRLKDIADLPLDLTV